MVLIYVLCFLVLMLLVLNKIGWIRWVEFVMTKSRRYIVFMLMLMFNFMRLRTIYYLCVMLCTNSQNQSRYTNTEQ